MGRVLPAFYQFFDDEGDVLSQGWLKFLEPSTNNTPKNTYVDENLTIANANPLQLSAAGRMPDAFGTGKYRIVSYKYDPADPLNPGEQVQVKDPVQAEGTTSGGAGGFEAWDNAVTYQLNDIVEHNNLLYRSLIVDNIGNNPTIETTLWEQVDFIRYWNAAISYGAGDLVYYSDNLYLSLQASNQNYNPVIRMDYWRAVATGIEAINYKTDNYEILLTEVSNLFVLSSATAADKAFTLPAVTATYDKFTVWIANDSDYNLTITPQLTADVWLEDPIITKGAMVELVYSAATDHWHVTGAGPVLGGQDIGTTTNPISTAHIDILRIVSSANLPDDVPLYFGDSNDVECIFTSATPAFDITSVENIVVSLANTKSLTININSIDYWAFDSTGPILPGASNPLSDIGSTGSPINDIYLGDSSIFYLGDDQDMEIYDDGTNGYIKTTTVSSLIFGTNDTDRWIISSGGAFVPNVANTYNIGTTVLPVQNIYLGDNCSLYLGNSQDFRLYFDGGDFIMTTADNIYITTTSLTGNIRFETNSTTNWTVQANTGAFRPWTNNTYDIGASSYCAKTVYYYTLSACSDERLKENFTEVPGLDFISQINPIAFNFKDADKEDKSKKRYGVSAQQVAAIKEDFAGISYDYDTDRYGMDYTQLIAPLIQAVKELSDRIDNLIIEPDNK